MYDPICKFLAERYSLDFARWILGREIVLTQLSPSELSLEPIRADAVILLESSEEVLHLEFQKEPDPDMGFRMLDYRTRVYRRFPNKEMRQVVIYLKKTGSELVEQTAFALSKTRHEFEVIKLWEMSLEELREGLGLLPLVVLGKTEDREETLRRVAERIERIENRQEKSNIAAATAILAGLVLEKEVIQKLLREDIMKDSVIYQDIREGGKAEGRQEEAASLILRQLNRRFGEISPSLAKQIQSLSVERLEQLGEALLDFASEEDLVNWLSSSEAKVRAEVKEPSSAIAMGGLMMGLRRSNHLLGSKVLMWLQICRGQGRAIVVCGQVGVAIASNNYSTIRIPILKKDRCTRKEEIKI